MTQESTGWGTAGIGHNSGEVEVQAPTFEVKYKAQPETEEPEAFRNRRNNEISTWRTLKENASQATDAEKAMRQRVTSTCFPSPTKGTQRYDLGNGYNVKLVHGLTYTLGNKDAVDEDSGVKIPVREQIERLEAEILAAHPIEGARILDRLISWKPEISGTEYEKLNDKDPVESDIARRISEHLTIKPASPQLTFEEPKEGK